MKSYKPKSKCCFLILRFPTDTQEVNLTQFLKMSRYGEIRLSKHKPHLLYSV